MNREQKHQTVEQMRADFGGAESLVIASAEGLKVTEFEDLRARCRQEGAKWRITKNSLARLALQGTKRESLSSMFTGPIGIAWSSDPLSAARVCAGFAKDNEKFRIKGGALQEEILDQAGVNSLAAIPPLEALQAKIVGLLQVPAGQLIRVLAAPASGLAQLCKARAEKG